MCPCPSTRISMSSSIRPFETEEPLPAVHIGIGCREVAPHEGIACQQHFLLGIIENDVVVAVAGSCDHLQAAGFGVDGLA